MKKIIKLFLLAVLALFSFHTQNLCASDQGNLLIIGARPWDENLRGIKGLSNADFVDFREKGNPGGEVSKRFHHLDLNDEGVNKSGKFSEFAARNPGKYSTIILDWITYDKIRRAEAWRDFSILLKKGGILIAPITSVSISTGKSQSEEKAKELAKALQKHFTSVDICEHEKMPSHQGLNLLKTDRSGMLKAMLSFVPSIIFATK